MKLLQCITDHNYIIWQLYVQMLNFRQWGIEQDAVILCPCYNGYQPSQLLENFMRWTNATVLFYPDTRNTTWYFSSFRPNLIKQYVKATGEHQTFFYHDQDIIFLKKPELDQLAEGPLHYVAEEACSYVMAAFVNAFRTPTAYFPNGHEHLKDMCDIVGISPKVVESMDDRMAVGGAQYVLKNTTYDFWDKVEHDCEAIYKKLYDDTAAEERTGIYHIQIWAADMWALLYNLWLTGDTRQHPAIDFAWPWDPITTYKPIMHNAGITEHNERYPDGMKEAGLRRYFNKSRYNGQAQPFSEDHRYIMKDIIQQRYVDYFPQAEKAMNKKKILGILCTHNKINKLLLSRVMTCIAIAADCCQNAYVQIVTNSWEEIENNPFEKMLTPFRELGHLNYILQLKEVLTTHKADITCILEHDVLYPENYFEQVVQEWDYGKYGIWNNNYIGMNETGYLDVKERHQPFSMLSCATFALERVLDEKLNECIRHIHAPDGWQTRYGWCCVEPDDKNLFKILPYTGINPCVHVNMNHTGPYGTGAEGKNHHFTGHADVCYEQEAKTQTHEYWGDYKYYFPNGSDEKRVKRTPDIPVIQRFA